MSADKYAKKPQPLQRRKLGRLFGLLITILLIVVFVFAPFTARNRSLIVMAVYDAYIEARSLPRDIGLNADMPLKAMDFYPIMITFNDDEGMSGRLGKPVRFTVDYTFADYDCLSGHSGFYDFANPLYNSYIGVYYLQGLGRQADQQAAFDIAEYDQRCLALAAIGLDYVDSKFEASGVKSSTAKNFAGYTWTCYDAAIITNGPEHVRTVFNTGYLQFGNPPKTSEHYPQRTMYGRIYITYFQEMDLNVGLYIIAKDTDILEKIDNSVISEVKLTWKK